MTNAERKLIKKKILKCLTEDFKGNQAIFDKKDGCAEFSKINLTMVMNAVCKGLEIAKYELDDNHINSKVVEIIGIKKGTKAAKELNKLFEK